MSVQTHQIWNTTAFKAASSKIFQSVMNADGKPLRQNSKRRHIGVLKHCSAFVHKHGTFWADVPGLGPKCRACGGMYHPWNECAVGVSLIPGKVLQYGPWSTDGVTLLIMLLLGLADSRESALLPSLEDSGWRIIDG
ncbi:hypothetical protein B0H10DRAFT_1951631 [Mycena sp. CBHHK59/15]|nr:hypothetical protein B0H10DRAFT_1951631 [Mycena sp. CBHHK59/15]